MAISGGDGSIILNTKVDTKGLNSGLNSMKGAITKIGGLLAAAFSVKMLINFAKESKKSPPSSDFLVLLALLGKNVQFIICIFQPFGPNFVEK